MSERIQHPVQARPAMVSKVGRTDRDQPADEFAEAVLARIAEARMRLADAAASVDSGALADALDELEDALALAPESGIKAPPTDREGTSRR